MLFRVTLVLISIFILSSANIPRDVDVFNKSYNRNQRNARTHLVRGFDIASSDVREIKLFHSQLILQLNDI